MDESFLKELNLPEFTPDRQQLETAELHAVFDYGRIKQNIPVLSSAYSVEKMSLLLRRCDHMPIALRLPHCPRARVYGVLYAMTTSQIIRLDAKRQNGLQFERKSISVYVPSVDNPNELEILSRPALAYIGISHEWHHHVLGYLGRDHWVDEQTFEFAKTYIDNNRILNGHYRYSDEKVEDAETPVPTAQATPEVLEYVRRMNAKEGKKTWGWLRPNRLNELRRKFKVKLRELNY